MNLPHIPAALLVLGTLAGAAVMIAWRVRESRSPVSTRKIVAPPLGMSTGFAMFLVPALRVPWAHAAAAFAAGALVLAIPLARSSRLVRDGEAVVLRRSRAFLWILLGLLAVRLALRSWAEQVIGPGEASGLLFILAFGMILRWRASMLLEYLRLREAPGAPAAGTAGAEGA